MLLTNLLERLSHQDTGNRCTYSLVVADNDDAESARPVVTAFAATSRVPVTYCAEPRRNIALARNKAIQHADGEFIAFIDDDEFPADDWLYQLFQTCTTKEVDGVLGPVKPHFESDPPRWVTKGGFFMRPTYPTGYEMCWSESRTGNVLFRRSILGSVDTPFRPEFATAGEDMDFFRRMIDRGHKFIWCNEAPVFEVVPSSRCRRRYLLKRALLRGSNFPKHPARRLRSFMTSLAAVPCYTLALPVVFVLGDHVGIKYLVKLCDHASRILAFLGMPLVNDRTALEAAPGRPATPE